jgi:succinate dehydrogenase flavin-adding protein (antitoxin of CptAB toxin-antitoxin module)
LRYREPVYNSIRELAMSFFHEYYDRKGRKNMRSYSRLLNLKRFDKLGWMTTKEEIDYVPEVLDEVKHYPIVSKKQIRNFRLADKIELETDKLLEWKTKSKGKSWY